MERQVHYKFLDKLNCGIQFCGLRRGPKIKAPPETNYANRKRGTLFKLYKGCLLEEVHNYI